LGEQEAFPVDAPLVTGELSVAANDPMAGHHNRDTIDRTGPLSVQVFQILLSLVDDDLHGYAIIQDVARRTDGEIRLTASTLYAAVKRLLDNGWIEELRQRPRAGDDSRRRYYRLTPRGRQAARAEALRVERLAGMARSKQLIGARR